jgi:hypothetical protein
MKRLIGILLATVLVCGGVWASCYWNTWDIIDPEDYPEGGYEVIWFWGDDGDEEVWTECIPAPEDAVCEEDIIVKYEDDCDITYVYVETDYWPPPWDDHGPNTTKTECTTEGTDIDPGYCGIACGDHGYCYPGESGCTHTAPTWNKDNCQCTCTCQDGETIREGGNNC